MVRGSRLLAGAASLPLVLLVIAAAAMAKPVAPETGPFYGTAQASGASSADNATFKVSKAAGGKLGVEVTITPLSVTCQTSVGAAPLTFSGISTKSFKSNGKGAPLAVKNGKFSYTGAIYGGSSGTGKAEISGIFKSPTKVVGMAKFSWESVTLGAGQTVPCESGKLTLAATHK